MFDFFVFGIFPVFIGRYLEMVAKLKFEEKPDYEKFRSLCRQGLKEAEAPFSLTMNLKTKTVVNRKSKIVARGSHVLQKSLIGEWPLLFSDGCMRHSMISFSVWPGKRQSFPQMPVAAIQISIPPPAKESQRNSQNLFVQTIFEFLDDSVSNLTPTMKATLINKPKQRLYLLTCVVEMNLPLHPLQRKSKTDKLFPITAIHRIYTWCRLLNRINRYSRWNDTTVIHLIASQGGRSIV